MGARDGAEERKEENQGLVPSQVLGGHELEAALRGEAGDPCLMLAWSSCP